MSWIITTVFFAVSAFIGYFRLARASKRYADTVTQLSDELELTKEDRTYWRGRALTAEHMYEQTQLEEAQS